MSAGIGSRLCLLIATFVLLAPGAALGDEYYRWVDDKGRSHFSDSYYEVPAEYRNQVDTKRDFDEQAEVSVVGGLNDLWAPKNPERTAAADDEAASRLDLSSLRGMQNPMELLEQFSGAMLAGVLGFMLLAVLAGLAFGALLLKLSCRIVGQESPGMWKAIGILLLQTVLGAVAQGTLQVALVADPGQVSLSSVFSLLALNALVGFSINVAVLRGLLSETLGKALAVQIVLILLGIGIALGLVAMVVVLGALLS